MKNEATDFKELYEAQTAMISSVAFRRNKLRNLNKQVITSGLTYLNQYLNNKIEDATREGQTRFESWVNIVEKTFVELFCSTNMEFQWWMS